MSYRNVTPNTATSSQNRLTDIRARLDAATPGLPVPVEDLLTDDDFEVLAEERLVGSGWADLIAHAPADIAWLLAEVEAWKQHCLACDCQRHCGVELTDCDCAKCKRYREQRA